MFWMLAYPLLGEVGGGWALEFPSFWAPNGTRLSARSHFTGPKKLRNSRAQPSPTSPRHGYAHIQNIMHGAV